MIYLDLDNTLLDSEARYEEEKKIVESFGIPREDYVAAVRELYDRFGKGNFTFELLFNILLKKHLKLSGGLTEMLNRNVEKQMFFPDAMPFLLTFPKDELVIVSEGSTRFQENKIRVHGLGEYVSDVFVIQDGPKSQVMRPEAARHLFLLDDAPRVIEEVKKALPAVICIQMRQPSSWELKRSTELADKRCADLKEAAEFILGYTR